MSAWDENDTTCAIYLARLYTQSYPKDVFGWVTLADVLLPLPPHSQEAIQALCRARRLASNQKEVALVYRRAGRFYFERAAFRRAEIWYRRALKTLEIGEHLIYLGTSLSRQGKFEEAKQCHYRAIQIGSEVADEAHCNLGLILRIEENYEEALKHLELAIELDPEYVIAKRVQRDILRMLETKSLIEAGINFVRGSKTPPPKMSPNSNASSSR